LQFIFWELTLFDMALLDAFYGDSFDQELAGLVSD
jgi:hypothetical protein